MVVKSEKSIDLLLGLLCFIGWYALQLLRYRSMHRFQQAETFQVPYPLPLAKRCDTIIPFPVNADGYIIGFRSQKTSVHPAR